MRELKEEAEKAKKAAERKGDEKPNEKKSSETK